VTRQGVTVDDGHERAPQKGCEGGGAGQLGREQQQRRRRRRRRRGSQPSRPVARRQHARPAPPRRPRLHQHRQHQRPPARRPCYLCPHPQAPHRPSLLSHQYYAPPRFIFCVPRRARSQLQGRPRQDLCLARVSQACQIPTTTHQAPFLSSTQRASPYYQHRSQPPRPIALGVPGLWGKTPQAALFL
ncbi:hypothetical protein BOTBODRAFT_189160, partial [Botryobasidium botryosum FD-172 SS1]